MNDRKALEALCRACDDAGIKNPEAIGEAVEALDDAWNLTVPGATSCEYEGAELLAEVRAVLGAALAKLRGETDER